MRRYAPWLVGTVLICAAAIGLSALGVRDVRRISSTASTIAGDWLVRMDRLLALDEALRSLRQLEAREALEAVAAQRAPMRHAVDSLARVIDAGLVDATVGLHDAATREAGVTLRAAWAQYAAAREKAQALPTGPGSAALAAFRTREGDFRSLTTAHERLQAATSSHAAQLARDNRAETRTITGIVLGGAVLTLLLAMAVIALIRLDRLRRQAEQRWEDVAGSELGMVWEVDADNRFVFASEQLARFFGRPVSDVLGRMPLTFVPPEEQADVQARYAPIRASGLPFADFEVRFVRADGAICDAVLAGVPIRDDTGRHAGFRGTAMDVTERRRVETAIARAQRLDSIGTLAGGIAHDFNNVLHAIGTYADLIGGTIPGDHVAHRDLQQIRDAGTRGKRLVERILTFSRARPRSIESVRLMEVVEEALGLLRPTLPSTITLDWQRPTVDPDVLADPTELHQVVINLLANAHYAMRDTGGTLRVRIGVDTPHGTPLARLDVADTGAGMSQEVLDRIFEPFFTTKPQSQGTGMGLAMVHGIVSGLGGRIDVDSAPGEGARFTVRLPAAHVRAEARPTPSDAPHVAAGLAGRRVLLVDDDPIVLHAMERLLVREGLDVTACNDPIDALAALRTTSPGFDLLLSDISMPTMTGLDMVERMRPEHPELPVILCSGYGGPDGAERAQSLGVHALLEKPTTARELREAITGALAG
ncbi:MAG: response regulator [Gemmatimonadaceae bacterium]|nr:response regulator [Gemmatimonadaceae bacterium]